MFNIKKLLLLKVFSCFCAKKNSIELLLLGNWMVLVLMCANEQLILDRIITVR